MLQQGQVATELLFLTRHPGHSQESLLGLNLFIISELDISFVAVTSVLVFNFCADDSVTLSVVFGFVFTEVVGLDILQQGHVIMFAAFLSKQPEHSQDPLAGLNLSIRSKF